MAKSESASGGIGFFGILCIVFIVLKLCNVIDWSWMWVLAPLWIPFSLALIVCGICFIAYCVVSALD